MGLKTFLLRKRRLWLCEKLFFLGTKNELCRAQFLVPQRRLELELVMFALGRHLQYVLSGIPSARAHRHAAFYDKTWSSTTLIEYSLFPEVVHNGLFGLEITLKPRSPSIPAKKKRIEEIKQEIRAHDILQNPELLIEEAPLFRELEELEAAVEPKLAVAVGLARKQRSQWVFDDHGDLDLKHPVGYDAIWIAGNEIMLEVNGVRFRDLPRPDRPKNVPRGGYLKYAGEADFKNFPHRLLVPPEPRKDEES